MTPEALAGSMATLQPGWVGPEVPTIGEVARAVCGTRPSGYSIDLSAWRWKALERLAVPPGVEELEKTKRFLRAAAITRYAIELYDQTERVAKGRE